MPQEIQHIRWSMASTCIRSKTNPREVCTIIKHVDHFITWLTLFSIHYNCYKYLYITHIGYNSSPEIKKLENIVHYCGFVWIKMSCDKLNCMLVVILIQNQTKAYKWSYTKFIPFIWTKYTKTISTVHLICFLSWKFFLCSVTFVELSLFYRGYTP